MLCPSARVVRLRPARFDFGFASDRRQAVSGDFAIMLQWLSLFYLERESSTTMSPQDALEEQINACRRITGQQRLQIALRMHEFACDVARSGIREQFPNADEDEVNQRLRQRLDLTRQ
jgi:hypothetical protein